MVNEICRDCFCVAAFLIGASIQFQQLSKRLDFIQDQPQSHTWFKFCSPNKAILPVLLIL